MVVVYYQACHLGLEVNLAPTLQNGVAHILYHTWQFVGAYVWVSIG